MPEKDSPLRPTVTNAIAALFEAKDRESITEVLIEECNAERLRTTNADAVERIQLAVIKLSEGNVEKFLSAVHTAQVDWRDTLVWAGFGNDLKAHLKWAEKFRS